MSSMIGDGELPPLSHRMILGLATEVRSNVHYVEDNSVLYPAGHSVVIYEGETKTQRFIHGSDPRGPFGQTQIVAVSLSPNKRFVAIAERGQEQGLVTVYDVRSMKRPKVLSSSDVASREFVSLCFSPDSKSLLTQGGAPDWALVNWAWQKAKPVHITKLSALFDTQPSLLRSPTPSVALGNYSVTQVSFCPADANLVCVSGNNVLLYFNADPAAAVFKVVNIDNMLGEASDAPSSYGGDDDFSPSPNLSVSTTSAQRTNYSCHAWLGNKKMVVASRSGRLLYLEDCTYLRDLADSPGNGTVASVGSPVQPLLSGGAAAASPSPASAPFVSPAIGANTFPPLGVECIAAYSSGFVVGCDGGCLRVYERDEKSVRYYIGTRAYQVATVQRVKDVNSGAPERLVEDTSTIKNVAVSPSEDTVALTTASGQLYSLKLFDLDSLKPDSSKFKYLVQPFHTGPITGLDACTRKPLVATCGLDKTVRIWNHETRELELCVPFAETAHCVAFHPSGFHLLVGFQDKLRLMNILMEDIRAFKEFPIKQCTEVQFSHGGHMFAAVNQSVVQIYNTYTCEQLHVLRGHVGVVKSLCWTLDDTAVISAGFEGFVLDRQLQSSTRRHEYSKKGCRFNCAVVTEEGKLYAAGDDMTLKEIWQSKEATMTVASDAEIRQLQLSHPPQRMLFAGLATGAVRWYKFPLTGDTHDFPCHSKPVNRLRISHADDALFSVSDDGCLALFDVKDLSNLSRSDRPDLIAHADEVLVTKSELEEKKQLLLELKAKVDELTASSEYSLRLRNMDYKEQLQKRRADNTAASDAARADIEALRAKKLALQMECDSKIEEIQSEHANTLHNTDLANQKALMREVALYQHLQLEMEREEAKFKEKIHEMEEQHAVEMATLRLQNEKELEIESKLIQEAVDDKVKLEMNFAETRHQLEVDYDREIEQLKRKYEKKLDLERDSTLRLKGENGIMQKQFNDLKKDIEEQLDNIRAMREKKARLDAQVKAQLETIEAKRAESRERDVRIGEKEKKIFDLKKNNQELEKFKFVLDYKIKDLKRQIEPREAAIGEMNKQVSETNKHLEAFHADNRQLTQQVADLQAKLKEHLSSIRRQRQSYRMAQAEQEQLKSSLHELVQFIQHPDKLAALTLKIVADFNSAAAGGGAAHTSTSGHVGASSSGKDAQKDSLSDDEDDEVTPTAAAADSTVAVEPEIKAEYERQHSALEHDIRDLNRKLERATRQRKQDNVRMVTENMALIEEINSLRKDIKTLTLQQKQRDLNRFSSFSKTKSSPASTAHLDLAAAESDDRETQQMLHASRAKIASLRSAIEQLQMQLRPPSHTLSSTGGVSSQLSHGLASAGSTRTAAFATTLPVVPASAGKRL